MNLFNRKKEMPKTMIGLLQKIYHDKYKTNEPFNIMILRNNTNDFQIIHSGLLKELGITNNNEFGYMILIPFDKHKDKYLSKFKNSKLINLFTLLSKDETREDYYYNCKLITKIVSSL